MIQNYGKQYNFSLFLVLVHGLVAAQLDRVANLGKYVLAVEVGVEDAWRVLIEVSITKINPFYE